MSGLFPTAFIQLHATMSIALYQKYRPRTFADIVGQHHVKTTLQNELQADAVSHAYLFSGPRGVGKTTTARLLAHALNVERTAEGEPELESDLSKEILAGRAMDIIEIDAASHTGVDHVREHIIEHARVAPAQLPKKVFIIDEVHMLSTSAFNALLKTLEEPPSHVVFILATTELHKVPATIISRCERFQFKRIGIDDLVGRLQQLCASEGVKVDEDVIHAIAKRADGALRDAESALGQVLSLGQDHITADIAALVLPKTKSDAVLDLWEDIVEKRAAAAIGRIAQLVDDGVQLREFTADTIEFLRGVLLYRVQESLTPLQYLDIGSDDIQRISTLSRSLSLGQISKQIAGFMVALEKQKTATIEQLPLELAIIELIGDAPAEPAPRTQAPVAAVQATTAEIHAAPLVDTPAAPVAEPAQQPEKPAQQPAVQAPQDTQDPQEQPQPQEPETPIQEAAAEEELPVIDIDEPVSGPLGMDVPDDSVADGDADELPPAVDAAVADQSTTTEPEKPGQPQQPEATATPAPSGGTMTIELVQSQWSDVLTAMKAKDHALHLTLKVGQLVRVEADMLVLGFEYQFYHDRINEAKNKKAIEDVLQSIFNTQLTLHAEVGDDYSQGDSNDSTGIVDNISQPSEDEVANVWDLATKSFGSQLDGAS